MKASTERKIMRWFHIIISIPVVGYIYGPVAEIPRAAFAVKFIIFPLIVLSGLWMWKGHLIKKQLRNLG
jgi:thiosulfate reductase cytochrome b subunit